MEFTSRSNDRPFCGHRWFLASAVEVPSGQKDRLAPTTSRRPDRVREASPTTESTTPKVSQGHQQGPGIYPCFRRPENVETSINFAHLKDFPFSGVYVEALEKVKVRPI